MARLPADSSEQNLRTQLRLAGGQNERTLGPHDVGGQYPGQIDTAERETAHWKWQIDTMIRLALKNEFCGVFPVFVFHFDVTLIS
tara:strand:- start:280 stop:534 length:255 start_codon:yes stop_codon:yes gene_type:complete